MVPTADTLALKQRGYNPEQIKRMKAERVKGDRCKETVIYRILICKHCHHIFKWIDERLPSYCPECGLDVYTRDLKHDFIDAKAILTHR